MKTSIHDIVQRDVGDFYRFSINDYKNGRFALIIDSKRWRDNDSQLRVETSAKRLVQLANEILNYLNKKVKWEEWKPTIDDFMILLRKKSPQHGMEFLFIDWIRRVVSMQDKDGIRQARRIYEWVHSNKDWLYEANIDE